MQSTTTMAAAPPGSSLHTHTPAVSVVVPTCARPALLERCLGALLQQSLPAQDYEIVVVDDRADPATRLLVEALRESGAARAACIRYVPNHGPHGPAAARNRGWRAARAANVAFTDDDTVPAHDWLEQGLGAFTDGVDALCGRIHMPLPPAPTDYERNAKCLEESEFVTANCFCRTRVLESLDGFDERFTLAWREDSDLHFRLLRSGARIAHAPQALVVHPVRPAPWGVSLLQAPKIAFDALLYKKHPQLYRERIRAAPRWDYYLTVASLLLALSGLAAGSHPLFAGAGLAWLLLTIRFCAMRLHGTARTFPHVSEMIVTSALIPPLAVFWRLAGALRYRVCFA
jgi:glycosyltransferase involved in cell wall biosynthesis